MSIDLPRPETDFLAKKIAGGRLNAPGALQKWSRSALLLAASTSIASVVVWAVIDGANIGLALMAGYTALVSTFALAIALAAPMSAKGTGANGKSEATTSPTFVAWKLVSTLTISDASRLWCNIEPGATATQESIAWGRALLDAVKMGDLGFVPRSTSSEGLERERQSPHYMTQVTRAALQNWADQKGHTPHFLRD
jgi:hypothetical protein